jgi:hypothetical protein
MKLNLRNIDKIEGMERGNYEVDSTMETLNSYRFYIRDNEVGRMFQIDLMKEGRVGILNSSVWNLRFSPTKVLLVTLYNITSMNILLSNMVHLITTYRRPLKHKGIS